MDVDCPKPTATTEVETITVKAGQIIDRRGWHWSKLLSARDGRARILVLRDKDIPPLAVSAEHPK